MLWLEDLPIELGSYLILDRGYIEPRRLRQIAQAGAILVVGDGKDVQSYSVQFRAGNHTTSVRSDQMIRFNGSEVWRLLPEAMRHVSIHDFEHHRRLAGGGMQLTR